MADKDPCFNTLQERLRYLAQVAKTDVMKGALTRAADRIDELENDPRFHHPDCAWWKWDWKYSWDKTDCTCDQVAGPSINNAG